MNIIPSDEISVPAGADEHFRRYETMLKRAEFLAGMGSWHWDIETNTTIWSEELYRIYGVTPGTPLSYETFLERLHPDDRERVQKMITASIEKQISFRHDERIIRPDGEMRILDSQGDVETEKNGKVKALFGFCRDVTEERLTQRALKEREERFAKIFHASPVATILTTIENDRVVDVNRRFLELTGYNKEELVRNNSTTLTLWEGSSGHSKFLSELRNHKSLREVRLCFRHRNGYPLHLIASVELIEIGGEDCMLCLVWRD